MDPHSLYNQALSNTYEIDDVIHAEEIMRGLINTNALELRITVLASYLAALRRHYVQVGKSLPVSFDGT